MPTIAGTASLITHVLRVVHHINTTRAESAAFAEHRNRILWASQMRATSMWHARPWRHRRVTATPTLSAGQVQLPTDFSRMGPDGHVMTVPDGDPVIWHPEAEIRALIRQNPGVSNTEPPRIYTLVRGTAGEVDILTWPPFTGSIEILYLVERPVLSDADAGGLDVFEGPWIDNLLLPGVMADEYRDTGQVSAAAMVLGTWRDKLMEMVKELREGDEQSLEMPRYQGSASVFDYDY